jgi:hypothetical protein
MITTLRRQNKSGLSFELRGELTGKYTVVHCLNFDKVLMMQHSITELNRGWFRWIRTDKFIQEAFDFLTPEEREFILNGTLPGELEELMKGINHG